MVDGEMVLSRSFDSEKVGVVAIGVSAGGLEALELFFSALPSNTGLAYVVIQHLSPNFKSMLSELLGRKTKMEIETVVDAMKPRPNTIYLMPAGKEMIFSGGKLLLTDRDGSDSLVLPIDHFFRSVGQELGPLAIAIVMSGSGSDGSRGICEIHASNGLVLCQSPQTAQFSGMPTSALESQVVDFVGSPLELASKVTELVHSRRKFGEQISSLQYLGSQEAEGSHYRGLFRVLESQYGIDFRNYKQSVVDRRIASRAQQWCGGDVERYEAELATHPERIEQLYHDLLIGVTEFFRDEKCYADLCTAIEGLLQGIPEGGTFRAWVPGCATGEEAYSLAILIDEATRRYNRNVDIKVFGSDVLKRSIDAAYAGVYSADSISKLSPERIERYFRPFGESYRVSTELRNRVVFAVHDLLKNPPFTQMHLISCRNLLIYFKPLVQKKVLSLLHFGLRHCGLLFLGSSESLGELENEFDCFHDKSKIFIKRRDVQLLANFRGDFGGRRGLHAGSSTTGLLANGLSGNRIMAGGTFIQEEHELFNELEAVLNACLPPTLLIDENSNLLRVFANAGAFLRPSDGAPSICLLDLVSGEVRTAVVAGMQRAKDSEAAVVIQSVPIEFQGQQKLIQLRVTPLRRGSNQPRFAISFEITADSSDRLNQTQLPSSRDVTFISLPLDRIAQLEQELLQTNQRLRDAINDSQASSETAQSTNEELMATNEELQGANEELQSVNEELFTVNAEYQGKIAELTELTNDMEHLLQSTDVLTLFLDRDLRIRKFTPKLCDVFHLVPEDIRRPIQNFTHNIVCDDLWNRLREVAAKGRTIERKVQDVSGNHYLMRIMPYRENEQINGVVMTLTDVTELIITQNQALEAAQRFERAVEASSDGIWDWPDTTSTQMWWSDACYRLLGFEPGEIPSTFEQWLTLIHPIDRRLIRETTVPDSGRCNMELHRDFDYRMRHKSGEYRWYRHRTLVESNEHGQPIRMTGSVCDIHHQRRAELQASLEIQRRDKFLAMLSHELRNPLAATYSAITLLKEKFSDVDENQCASSSDLANDHSANRVNQQSSNIGSIESLDVIDRQVSHMRRLLDDLLDVARIQHDKIDLRMQTVDLAQMSRNVLQSVQHQLSLKQQRLRVSVPAKTAYVSVDLDRMVQAQVNLLINASKYSDCETDIYYEVDIEDDYAIIEVRDHGQGIAEGDLDSIFELFFQADQSLDHPFGGMGVGLSLAKGIIDAHGGSIEASSDGEGQGTSMTIRLPLVEYSGDATDSAHPVPAPHHIALPRMIVVEDNLDVLRLTGQQMKQCGFEVICAADGYEALERINEFQPKVALIDIGLPGMNGFQLARKIRETALGQSMLMIAVTGYGDQASRDHAKDAGFQHHFIKPLRTHEIKRVVMESLLQQEESRGSNMEDEQFGDTVADQSSSSSSP